MPHLLKICGHNIFKKNYQQVFDKKYFVDSVFRQMSTEEQLGQLFMIAAYSNKDSTHFQQLNKLVKYYVGGLIFFKSTPCAQAA